eukprot:2014155-Rhodomonas_salina.1
MLGEGGFAKVYIGKHRETAQVRPPSCYCARVGRVWPARRVVYLLRVGQCMAYAGASATLRGADAGVWRCQEVAVKVIDVEKWKLNRGTLRTEQVPPRVPR